MDNFPTIGGSSAFQSASLKRGSSRGRGRGSFTPGAASWPSFGQNDPFASGQSNFQGNARGSRGPSQNFSQSRGFQGGRRGTGLAPTGQRQNFDQGFGGSSQGSSFQPSSQGFQGRGGGRGRPGQTGFGQDSAFGSVPFNKPSDGEATQRGRGSRDSRGGSQNAGSRDRQDGSQARTSGRFQGSRQQGQASDSWSQAAQAANSWQSGSRDSNSQNMGPSETFRQGSQVSDRRGRGSRRGAGNESSFQGSRPQEQTGMQLEFKKPERRQLATRGQIYNGPSQDRGQDRFQRGRGSRGRGGRDRNEQEPRGGFRGHRGRGNKVPIMNRIKKADNVEMDEELSSVDEDEGQEEFYSGDEELSYSGEEEYSRDSYGDSDRPIEGSFEDERSYDDDGESNKSYQKEQRKVDREPPAKTLAVKPKTSLLDRIKPVNASTVVTNPVPKKIVPPKVMVSLPKPPPPLREDATKDRLKKPAVEIPILQKLTSRRSERDQEGTPHNKEVNSTLLAKVDRFGDNELMTRKYRLYLQKRKKKCIGGPRDLMLLVNKFENLDLKNASCFAMCSREEIVKRQAQGDIDLMERTDNAQEKRIRSDYAIKKFTRSSADQHLDKPEILRPPFILAKTLEHITTRLLDDDSKDVSQFPPPSDGRKRADYLDIYLFVSDRLRSVKQDIQILSSHCPEIFCSKIVIQIYEQIVRFYILSCNELLDREGFDPRINLEQLSSAFTSLMQCYKLSRQSLAAMYLKYNGQPEAMMEMVEEVIYISPCEAEFMSLNLLMLFFEKEASFQTALQSIEKDHPEVLESPHLDAVLRIVATLTKRNYAQYLRTMSETKDLLLGHVMGLPEFVNTVRIKYFYVLKSLTFSSGSGMATEGQTAPLSEYQRRLHIDTLEEMKYFLTFMHGKKNKGFELFNVERDVVNLDYYTADIGDLLSKISKIKLNKPIRSLVNGLAATSATNKREVSVKGPKKDNTEIVKLAHRRISAAVRATTAEFEQPEEEEVSEEAVSEEEPVVSETPVVPKELPKKEISVAKKTLEVDGEEAKKSKLAKKKKGAEMSLLLLKKKVKTIRRGVFQLWSMYSVAKSAEQLEKLREYLIAKNEQTKFDCFDLWRHQVYKRRALLEEIMEIPDFDGTINDVICEEYVGLSYQPEYNYYQTFIMLFFRHLLRKWFEILVPQTILSQNLGTVRNFKLSWLFVVSSKSAEARYLAPFLGLFLLTPEESLAAILEGKKVDCEYYIDNWIDREGVMHPGRITLTLTLACKQSTEIVKTDVSSNDFLVVFDRDRSLENQINRWQQELSQVSDSKYDSQRNAYFRSFSDLTHDCSKQVIWITPLIENSEVGITIDSLKLEAPWHYFNYSINQATMQAFLTVCLKRLTHMVDWIDETFFSGNYLNLKVMDQAHEFNVQAVFTSLLHCLVEIESKRVSILTDEDLFLDPESQRFVRKTTQTNMEGFFFLRTLLAEVINEMVMEASVTLRDNSITVRILKQLHRAITSESMNQDAYLMTPKNMLFYKYVTEILASISEEWRSLFTVDINHLIWSKVIAPINYNPYDHFTADWLQFFTHLLECMAECVRLADSSMRVRLVNSFEVRMLLDINYNELYQAALHDHKKFTMQQHWTPDRLTKFTMEMARSNETYVMGQSLMVMDTLTQQTVTPSESDTEDDSAALGKRSSQVEFSQNSLANQFITRLLKL